MLLLVFHRTFSCMVASCTAPPRIPPLEPYGSGPKSGGLLFSANPRCLLRPQCTAGDHFRLPPSPTGWADTRLDGLHVELELFCILELPAQASHSSMPSFPLCSPGGLGHCTLGSPLISPDAHFYFFSVQSGLSSPPNTHLVSNPLNFWERAFGKTTGGRGDTYGSGCTQLIFSFIAKTAEKIEEDRTGDVLTHLRELSKEGAHGSQKCIVISARI